LGLSKAWFFTCFDEPNKDAHHIKKILKFFLGGGFSQLINMSHKILPC
jgi:hypothetical protein